MSQLDHGLNKDRWNELKNDFKKANKEESFRNSKFSLSISYAFNMCGLNVIKFLLRCEKKKASSNWFQIKKVRNSKPHYLCLTYPELCSEMNVLHFQMKLATGHQK